MDWRPFNGGLEIKVRLVVFAITLYQIKFVL